MDVEITYDGEDVEAYTSDVPPDAVRPLPCTWPREPGQFVVAGRLSDDGERSRRSLSDADSDAAAAVVSVGETGDLRIHVEETDEAPSGFADACSS